jgi:hemoglobin-like flavoprotein
MVSYIDGTFTVLTAEILLPGWHHHARHSIIPAIYPILSHCMCSAAAEILLSSLKYNHVSKSTVWTLTYQNLGNIMNIQYNIGLQMSHYKTV